MAERLADPLGKFVAYCGFAGFQHYMTRVACGDMGEQPDEENIELLDWIDNIHLFPALASIKTNTI